jgi:hypothetical protein
MKKHYKVLGLEEGASKAEIEKKYKELSKEYDPKNNDNQEFFKEEYEKVQEAYKALITSNILKNPEKKPKKRPVNSGSSVSEEKPEESDDTPIIPINNPKKQEIDIKKLLINILILISIVVSLVCLLTLEVDRPLLYKNSNLSEKISIWRTLVYSSMCITISALFSLVYFNKK